jgi:serine/threonine-protein kinase RsbT
MLAGEPTDVVIEALKAYFSVPIARALVLSTVRRAKLDGAPLEGRAMAQMVTALEHALPMYIADASRRGECVGRLQRLVKGASVVPDEAAPRSMKSPVAPNPSIASTVIQVLTADDVANACEVGRDIARRVGFPNVMQTKIATAIAELARNILLYAISGELRIAAVDAPRRGVEVGARDKGPGIADLELVMTGNYRSRTGMGMGLRGAKRLMDTFEIDTGPAGTNVLTRKFLT